MKHLLLLLVTVVFLYVAWQLSDHKARNSGMRFVMHHAIRLGGLVLLLLLLVAAAVYLPATSIL